MTTDPGAAAALTICPECASGKHPNCDGTAWCPETDDLTPCTCPHHGRPRP